MYTEQAIIAVLAAINIFSLLLMARDKRKSIRKDGSRRTPEGLIFFFATIFGSVGVYVGMQLFRHKTKKWYFQLGIPLLILQNLVTLYTIRELVTLY